MAEYQTVLLYVRGGDPQIQAAAEEAVRLWNTSVGAVIARLVPQGTPGAVDIFKNTAIKAPTVEASAIGFFDQMGNYVSGTGHIEGNAKGLRDPITMAHEIGHVLGLAHPSPNSTFYHYRPTKVSTVAPIGLMGNGWRNQAGPGTFPLSPAAPFPRARRDNGPSIGEVRYLQRKFGVAAPARPSSVKAEMNQYNPVHQQI